MKKYIKYFSFFLLLFTTIYNSYCQNLNIMTYNIRYDNPADGENSWDNRKAEMAALLTFYHPDIFGTQEGLLHQLEYLDSSQVNYSYFGVGRTDGKKKGEYTAIFYDSTKFSIKNENTFWLSESGDTGSVGWDAALERICTYALIEVKESKKRFWLFNAHFDHVGENAREESASLISNKIKKLNSENLPVIMMGDLNSETDSKAIDIFNSQLQDGKEISQTKPTGPFGTFNDFKLEVTYEKRIDYIFVSKFKVISYKHIDDRKKNGFQVSDHYPVLMRATLNY